MFAGERFFARIFENDDGSTDLPRTFAAGWGSGILESVLVCPFEVLKVRLFTATQYLSIYYICRALKVRLLSREYIATYRTSSCYYICVLILVCIDMAVCVLIVVYIGTTTEHGVCRDVPQYLALSLDNDPPRRICCALLRFAIR